MREGIRHCFFMTRSETLETLIENVMMEAVPRMYGVGFAAALGNMDDNGRVMVRVEDIINGGWPYIVADNGSVSAADINVGEPWALLESPFHKMGSFRYDN